MRLWHEALIPYLPRQQLLGQHRECCALRGLGWGKKHATVNYVFEHPYGWLVVYHHVVISEMLDRGYKPDPIWVDPKYCGKLAPAREVFPMELQEAAYTKSRFGVIYHEHNDQYLKECLENLERKGIHINMED